MINGYQIITADKLDESVKGQLIDLWNKEYPENISYTNHIDFETYLQKLTNVKHFLVVNIENMIFGWAFVFNRDNERWFAIILDERIQGKGVGREILELLKSTEPVLNGWVVDHSNDLKRNGQFYRSPIQFYEQCGFKVLPEVRHENDTISAVKIIWIA